MIARELVVPWSRARMKDIVDVGRLVLAPCHWESFGYSFSSFRLPALQTLGEEFQHFSQMSFPVGPAMPTRKFLINVRNAGLVKFPVKLAVVFNQLIFRTAIKPQRRQTVAVLQHSFQHRLIFFG